jgi:hypothetical protein
LRVDGQRNDASRTDRAQSRNFDAATFMPATLVEAIASPIDGKTNMSLSSQISSRTWPNGAEDALRS